MPCNECARTQEAYFSHIFTTLPVGLLGTNLLQKIGENAVLQALVWSKVVCILPSLNKIVEIGFLFDSRKMCVIIQAKDLLRAQCYSVLFELFYGRPAQIDKIMQISK